MKKTQKILSLSLILTALCSSFLAFSSSTYAVSILPVDTILQQAYLRSQSSNFNSLSKSLSRGGDIYDSAYALARKDALQTSFNAITNVANNLNAKYGCSLTNSDISKISATEPSLNAAFAGLANRASLEVDSTGAVRSCVRVVQCAKGNDAPTAAEMIDSYTIDTFPLCREIVGQALSNTMTITAKQTTLSNANRGDDIFFNGTLDDSPYDLLVDMQLIGDILFKSNTAAPQIILYDFPGAGGNSSGNPTFFDPTGNGGTNLSIGGSNSANSSVGGGNNTSNTNSSSVTISVSNNTALNNLSSYHQNLQNGTTTTNNQNTLTTTSSNNGLACVTGTINPTLTQEEIEINQIAEATSLESAISTYNSAINAPQALYEALMSPELQGNNNGLSAIANLGNDDNGNGSADSDPTSALNSCMNKCDPLAPSDKALCQAKCLCGSQYSDNGIFGISVCTVPTAQTEVIGGKTVKSVEEIVDEINNILIALKNSGQLMKHTKTKEFLDTSLSKIKLNQILSFDMNVAFKPMYNSNLDRTKKESQKSQQDAISDRARQGLYIDSDVGAQKNKYLVIKSPLKTLQESSTLATNDPASTATSINPTLPYDLAKTLNNEMLNAIGGFMDKNALLWQQVGATLNAINNTSSNLEKKIQKGN